MNTLLITGGSGFVGQNLARFFAPGSRVIITYLSHPTVPDPTVESVRLDIRDAEEVLALVDHVVPNVVIHAAGNKDVRFCQDHPDEAYRINALGAQNVARACRNFGASMIYLSTDLVFDCTRGGYKEDESPQPTLAYGKSKLQGERLVLKELEDAVVCRSAGIYGMGSPLLRWFSAEIDAGRRVDCFVDVFNTPTYAENLAEMIEAIIRNRLFGVFHTAGRERVSRFQFFWSYADTFGLDLNLLSPVSVDGPKERLLLQPDSSLSVEQTCTRLDIAFNSVMEGFTRLKASGYSAKTHSLHNKSR